MKNKENLPPSTKVADVKPQNIIAKIGEAPEDFSALPNEVKERIKLEELYRQSVLKEKEPEKEESAVWKAINQPFMVFLFSSVILAGITSLYQQNDQKEKRLERVKRVGHEIGHRSLYLKRALGVYNNFKGPDVLQYDEAKLKEKIKQLEQIIQDSDKVYLFPDYSNWNTMAVISAGIIENQVNGVDEKNYKELSRLRTALTLLRDARADISRVNSSYNKEAAQSVLVNAFLAKGVIDIYVDSEDVYIKDKQDDPKMLQLEIKSSQK